MRSSADVEKLIKNAEMRSDPDRNQAVLDDLMHQFDETQEQESAVVQPKIRRTIMKSPITKLAAAAAVITVVALGLSEFPGSGSTSSVVWAEVARKVEASRGVIFRSRDTGQDSLDDGSDHAINYRSGALHRADSYKADQLVKTVYSDFNTRTVVLVDHGHKSHVKMTFDDMERDDSSDNPITMVQRFLSHEHAELGQKTIEGVLCEGFETTVPAFDGSDYPTDSLMARIWISLETGYPVKFEIDIVRDGGEIPIGGVADQFQWDVEIDEDMFAPDIPADYIDISPGELRPRRMFPRTTIVRQTAGEEGSVLRSANASA
jgi:hypothetical protein